MAIEMKNMISLSKALSYALRHAPWEYELELDDQGWVLVDDLLNLLAQEKSSWTNLTINDLHIMIEQSEKKRHEIRGDKIRALYGHSTPNKLTKEKATPPSVLYHGTSPKLIKVIMNQGLKPMSRHYVHLSIDVETARQVGSRKASKPIILAIDSEEANKNGVIFYRGNDKVWLADVMSPDYIKR